MRRVGREGRWGQEADGQAVGCEPSAQERVQVVSYANAFPSSTLIRQAAGHVACRTERPRAGPPYVLRSQWGWQRQDSNPDLWGSVQLPGWGGGVSRKHKVTDLALVSWAGRLSLHGLPPKALTPGAGTGFMVLAWGLRLLGLNVYVGLMCGAGCRPGQKVLFEPASIKVASKGWRMAGWAEESFSKGSEAGTMDAGSGQCLDWCGGYGWTELWPAGFNSTSDHGHIYQGPTVLHTLAVYFGYTVSFVFGP